MSSTTDEETAFFERYKYGLFRGDNDYKQFYRVLPKLDALRIIAQHVGMSAVKTAKIDVLNETSVEGDTKYLPKSLDETKNVAASTVYELSSSKSPPTDLVIIQQAAIAGGKAGIQHFTTKFRRVSRTDLENAFQHIETMVKLYAPTHYRLLLEAKAESPPQSAPAPPRASQSAPPPPPAAAGQGTPCDQLLAQKDITDRKGFLKWSLTGHPDKGGDTKVFQEVSDCVDKKYAKGGRRKSRKVKKSRRKTTKKTRRSY